MKTSTFLHELTVRALAATRAHPGPMVDPLPAVLTATTSMATAQTPEARQDAAFALAVVAMRAVCADDLVTYPNPAPEETIPELL